MSTRDEETSEDRESPGSGDAGGQVAPDQTGRTNDGDAGWSAGQVAKDQEPHENERSGWSGSEVVKDQDREPEDKEAGWNADQVTTDLGPGHHDHEHDR